MVGNLYAMSIAVREMLGASARCLTAVKVSFYRTTDAFANLQRLSCTFLHTLLHSPAKAEPTS